MREMADRQIAVIGVGAVMPDALDAPGFWENIKNGRYSIGEVPRDRWDAALYYDADPRVPDRTYSAIGAFVRDFEWKPLEWHLPIPPRVSEGMDRAQKWAIVAAREALHDYGYPQRPLDRDRTAVILGNAMAGDKHYLTAARIMLPEFADELGRTQSFAALAPEVRAALLEELRVGIDKRFPKITEDTMPGELANIIAGRVAALFDLHGPNFVTDAACASAMAAFSAGIQGLLEGHFDAVLTGAVDSNMSASTYIKFCKVGALSATGSRPYAAGADGFVMGEGAAVLLLKRLADAEKNGDRIYAVLRGIGSSSDGKGKGITAPNPLGQRLAMKRAWEMADLSPASATLIEGHGTSTRVGDAVELECLEEVFAGAGAEPGSIALGSVKSNIGHLKGAAGAAGLLKTVLALHYKVMPPSLGVDQPNPALRAGRSPFLINSALRPWDRTVDGIRRAGVSAFGFGGTNFHAVLEEYQPGRESCARRGTDRAESRGPQGGGPAASAKPPLRGALVLGGPSLGSLAEQLEPVARSAAAGVVPLAAAPAVSALRAPARLSIDYADAPELAAKASRAKKALELDTASMWRALRPQGILFGRGPAGRIAFLYPGQGSQYLNMLRTLRDREPVVASTFAEADEALAQLLGRRLSDYIFVDGTDTDRAEEALRDTAITQPAVLTADVALTRLLAEYGVKPDMVMGHSLGEYGALVAAGSMSLRDALEAVSARGREMARVAVADNGAMVAVFGPLETIQQILGRIDGYVVVANINSNKQAVIGGATLAVQRAAEALQQVGMQVVPLPVSHAFHTAIVAPASEPLRRMLERLQLRPPRLPVVANVTGEFYPEAGGSITGMLDILARQVAAPVEFRKGLHTLYAAGARVFVEVGPKKALAGFVEDVLGEHDDVLSLFCNHPKQGDVAAFNQAMCGLYAAGLGSGSAEAAAPRAPETRLVEKRASEPVAPRLQPAAPVTGGVATSGSDRFQRLGQLFAEVMQEAAGLLGSQQARPASPEQPPVVSGVGLGLPGGERVFDDKNVARILRGEQLITSVPAPVRQAMLDKNIVRLVKTGGGEGSFQAITSTDDVVKLAGRAGALDLAAEFGVPADRIPALELSTRLAIGAGIEALRDAGIPMVMQYKTTTTGTRLPNRWMLPEALRDDTGIIFGSAFPVNNSLAEDMGRYAEHRARLARLEELEWLRTVSGNAASDKLDHRINALRAEITEQGYRFDRRYIFRVLCMGHSQLAEIIGARGPNTHINAACASGAQAVALAQDWIRAGRCRRVLCVTADDVTNDELMQWMGTAFLAAGAAATDERVEDAAVPFDRRRHGMILGMGAAALLVESADSLRERGLRPICEVLGAVFCNSAYHGTRLDVEHITQKMEELVAGAEARHSLDRRRIAEELVFVSHETFTPARGGSAQAEVQAMRRVFGPAADRIVVANTKGLTGHAMAAGVEDAVAVKILETGIVPPVVNFKEVDPELGLLNLSKGGSYPVRYTMRLAAGFGSQLALMLLRWVPSPEGRRPAPEQLGYASRLEDRSTWERWLETVSGRQRPSLEVAHRTLRITDRAEAVYVGAGARFTPPTEEMAPLSGVSPAPAPRVPVLAPSPAAAAPQSAARPPEPGPTASRDGVTQSVLELVAKQTGYPTDMLDLDLDLEADLGIDTVKQAETFAAVRQAYNISQDEQLRLRDFPTLAHVINWVREKRPDLAQSTSAVSSTSTSTSESARDPIAAAVLDLVALQTGYPTDMLDLDLDLEADLGIDTVKQAETFAAVRQAYNISQDEQLRLRDFPTLGHVIQWVRDQRPDLAPSSMTTSTSTSTSATPTSIPTPAPTGGAGDPIVASVLGLVAKQTGYPVEMLDLDLDLEADLGIDTVKQAETFAAVRQAYAISGDEQLRLRDFPTLGHVVGWVRQHATESAGADSSTSTSESTSTIQGDRTASAAIPRHIPRPTLRPPLELCKPSGVKLTSGSRVLVVPDRGGAGSELFVALQRREVQALVPSSADLVDRPSLRARIEAWLADGPIQGVYWLPALDSVDLGSLDLPAWREALQLRVKLLHETLRALDRTVGERGTFLVAATRLGGRHCYDPDGAFAPLGGAVSGFGKTFKRERPDALVKVVDFGANEAAATVAERLIDETERDPGAVEIGYHSEMRWTVALDQRPSAQTQAAPEATGLKLGKGSVVVVTGAAGSIVSAIVADLARQGGTFYLLDKAPAPDPADTDLKRFVSDREGLKQDIFQRLKERRQRATPALVERELAGIERRSAALAAISAVQAAGGAAHYLSVDLRDADAVSSALGKLRQHHRSVDLLLHGAGLEISHRIADKSADEFDLVFDVKADGWFNVLHALGDLPLAAAVSFCSIAGRFGNPGQTDYAAANDLLCKLSTYLPRLRPETQAIAIDWTAWGEIGMASRGSIPKTMERAGISTLPPAAGIPIVGAELAAGSRGEVLVALSLGALLEECDESGGLEPSAVAARAQGPMIGRVLGMGIQRGLLCETRLEPSQPFLNDHRIDGTPVLPGVMGIESFVELSQLVFPGWQLAAIENVQFLAPFKLYRDEPRPLTLEARFELCRNELVARCRLVGERQLAHQAPQVTTHFVATVRMNREPQSAPRAEPPALPARDGAGEDPIYRLYFHGPAYRVLERAWREQSGMVARLQSGLPPNHKPESRRTGTDPRLVEACFQAAGLWEMAESSRFGLPFSVSRLRTFSVPGPSPSPTPRFVVMRPRPDDEGCFDGHVVDGSGQVHLELSGYRTTALPGSPEPELLSRLRDQLGCPAGSRATGGHRRGEAASGPVRAQRGTSGAR